MSRENNFIKTGKFTCECGREFSKSQSLYGHQSHCRVHLGDRSVNEIRYHTVKGEYSCVCGRVFDNSSSYIGHTSHCKVYLGEERYLRNKEITQRSQKIACEASRTSHTEESRARQSETRKRKYKSGELTPAPGVGKGKYSYLNFNGTQILLRSTYEFIYALYLIYNSVEFEYESVRVTYDGHTYISDFRIGNKIVEIKGNYRADTSKQRKAFESLGYQYEVKFWKDIEPCYLYLKSRIDIDSILERIREGHDSKNYYVYNVC